MQEHILALQEMPETATDVPGQVEPGAEGTSLSFTITFTILTYA